MRIARSALIAAAAVVLASLGPASPALAETQHRSEYVALGDSYAAGVGAAPYDEASGDCLRSPQNYPSTWAAEHPAYQLTDVTCSGAATDDVWAQQLDALDRRTRLVTLTIGGNDDNAFSRSLQACLLGTDADCKAATTAGSDYARTQLVGDLVKLYTEVHRRSPWARVIVLNYPQAIDQGTGSCGAVTPNTYRRALIADQVKALDAAITKATRTAWVELVDVRSAFTGHQACSTDPWIHGSDTSSQTEWFHPNATGHAVYASALDAVTS